jgi:membrane-associated protease RseP (regulator of RpoE activity)
LTKLHVNGSSVQLEGVVIEKVGDIKIEDKKIIGEILKNTKPGDKLAITIKTTTGEEVKDIIPGANPMNTSVSLLGVTYPTAQKGGSLMSNIISVSYYFKDPTIAYEPAALPELTLLIYNLLLWLILINFSVALINMWPVAIFDGGRTFMLTVWAITKSEKFAKIAFKVMTYAVLACVLLIIMGYFLAMLPVWLA